MELQEVRDKYLQVMGKRPFHGWNKETLEAKMLEPIEEPKEEVNDILESARIENEMLMQEAYAPEPVYKDGEAFYIIDNKYVPYWEGKVKILEIKQLKIAKEIAFINKTYLSN